MMSAKVYSLAGALFLLASCSSLNMMRAESDSPGHQAPGTLESAQFLFQQGKYPEAAGQYKRLVRNKHQAIAEKAQFQLAYTLAYYRNPKRDYEEALNEFQTFVERFSRSPLKAEASNWIFLIEQYMAKKSENNKLREDIKKLVGMDIETEQKQERLK
jgi:outer membrane protein assembly factor BamD (BamD/ComL family)